MTQTLEPALTRAHDSFRHEAAFYSGVDDFVRSTTPFVRDGVRSGQPVMVAVVPERLEPLREELGSDADDVWFVDMAEVGRNPASIIPAWQVFVDALSPDGRPVRGVGEPVWAGRRSAELVECQLHEALLNTALSPDTALWLRCPYDVAALPDDVVEHAHRSHPTLVEGDAYRGSTEYTGADLVDHLFAARLTAAPPTAESQLFSRKDYAAVRRQVRRAASQAGLTPRRTDDLVLAAHEIATNSVRHGGGRGELLTWASGEAVLCEVRDRGVISDPLVGRTWPAPTDLGGRGVWMANQLCDLVQVRSGVHGTTVRLTAWLP